MEMIFDLLFISTGMFVRWLFFGRNIKFKEYIQNGDVYWHNLLVGIIVWICIGGVGYYFCLLWCKG